MAGGGGAVPASAFTLCDANADGFLAADELQCGASAAGGGLGGGGDAAAMGVIKYLMVTMLAVDETVVILLTLSLRRH